MSYQKCQKQEDVMAATAIVHATVTSFNGSYGFIRLAGGITAKIDAKTKRGNADPLPGSDVTTIVKKVRGAGYQAAFWQVCKSKH